MCVRGGIPDFFHFSQCSTKFKKFMIAIITALLKLVGAFPSKFFWVILVWKFSRIVKVKNKRLHFQPRWAGWGSFDILNFIFMPGKIQKCSPSYVLVYLLFSMAWAASMGTPLQPSIFLSLLRKSSFSLLEHSPSCYNYDILKNKLKTLKTKVGHLKTIYSLNIGWKFIIYW